MKEGFSWPALLIALPWLLWHRMWIVLVFYLALGVGLGALSEFGQLSDQATTILSVLVALFFGFEGNSLLRWTLARRGYEEIGEVAAETPRAAEMRFSKPRCGARPPAPCHDRGHRRLWLGQSALGIEGAPTAPAATLDDPPPILITADPEAVRRAERIVLPGVGAFRDCRDGIAAIAGMMEAIPSRQSRKAPTPGRTMRSARRTASGSAVMRIGGGSSRVAAARWSAFDAERRLPEP